MRLHRDDQPGRDEPDDGWETTSAGPSGPLADVLGTWTVVRRWRGVQARTAVEAIEATKPRLAEDWWEPGGEPPEILQGNDEVNVTRGELALLYHSKSELEALLAVVAPALADVKAHLDLAIAESIRAELRAQLQMLYSLQTQLTEARWSLMTHEEIEQETNSDRRQ